MLALYGNGVGHGIAIGTARVMRQPGQDIPSYDIEPENIEQEVARLEQAIRSAAHRLAIIDGQLPSEGVSEIRAILRAQSLMLDDPMLGQETVSIIRGQCINAEAALQRHAADLEKIFSEINDPYLSGKSVDVAQVINRIQGALIDDQNAPGALSEGKNSEGASEAQIIVANDLTPADTIELNKHHIRGFITNLGSPVSHTAILAKSLKIPAIVGLHGGIRYLRNGERLIIDGKRGAVLANPDQSTLQAYRIRREKILRRSQELESLAQETATTLDGVEVALNANIGLPGEALASELLNADGVGLYRTEFLYMNRAGLPDEEEQYREYSRILKQTIRSVTFRTLDIGGDKPVAGIGANNAITNPALGRRAIRLCLHDLALFKPQLRAIYRAAVHGRARLLAPMLSSMDELDQLFLLLREIREELRSQGFSYDPDVPVGGMIEVPAAAVAADLFADRLDFLAIGTNDLIQYTLAIDRVDDDVSYLYDPLHPSILRLIKSTIDAGKTARIPVSMCGEMAGDVRYTRVLLGLGLRDFSMEQSTILEVKRQVRLTNITRIQPLAERLLKMANQKQVRQLMDEINA